MGFRGLLAIILLCCSVSAMAQQWAADGTVWTYEERHAFSALKRPVHFTVDGDTAINGQIYKRIISDRQGYDYFPGDTNLAYTYEEEGRVNIYDFNRDTTTMLFDFNAWKGATWVVQWNTCKKMVEVQKVDSVMINGSQRKRLTIGVLNAGNRTLIQGIGNLFEMFPTSMFSYSCDPLLYDGEYLSGLRCFEQPGFGKWNTGLYGSCDTVITGLYDPKPLTIDISPNPVSAFINVELPAAENWTLELFAINGQKLKTWRFNDKQQTIHFGDLHEGLYILRVISGDGNVHVKRLIKQ